MNAPKQIDPARSPSQWLTPLRFGIVLAAFLFLCFPKVLLGMQSFFFRDYGVLGYPFIYHARESFWQGELPLWNPLSNCGAPFLAQWGTMTLYPFSLLYLLLPLPWSLSIFCFAHLVLGGVGMYRLANRWVNHPFAASIAGMAFVFNGFTFACLIWPNYTVALGWMPWVVLLGERAWREGGGKVIVAALASAMQMLSGVPELVLLTWLVLGVHGLSELWHEKAARGRMLGRLFMVVLITSGLVAAQVIPFLDLLAHSQRQHGAVPVKWAMPLWGWANLLVPLFHFFETPQGQFFQYDQEFLSSYYLGAGVLVLAGWAVFAVRQRRAWTLAAITLFGLVMALGNHVVFYDWIKTLLPAVGLARYPVKFVALAAFAVPLLAAMAVQRWQEESWKPTSNRSLAVAAGLVLSLMGVLLWVAYAHPFRYDQWDVTFRNALWRAGFLVLILALLRVALHPPGATRSRSMSSWRESPWGPRLAGLGVLAVIAVDTATHSPRQNPTLPSSVFQPDLWSQAFELPAPRFGESRLMISPQAETALLRSSVKSHEQNFMGKRLAEWSNLNVLDGIPKVNGATTLQLGEQMQVQTMLYAETNRLLHGLMDYLGVSTCTAPGAVVDWVRRPGHLPLVTAGQRPVFVDGTNALPALAAADFDPREVVYLPREIEAQVLTREKTLARIVSTNISAHRLEFEIEARDPSLVTIGQSFYHPWVAEVDGIERPLWRANHAFQALEVPDGRHHVVVRYDDGNFKAGAAISLATLLGCLLWWVHRQRTAAGS